MTALARVVVPRKTRHWLRRRLGKTPEWNVTSDYRPSRWPPAGMTVSAPDAKVLAILRDPVERFRSGIELQRDQRVVDAVTTLRQVGIGEYARQLAALETFVDPAQVLVLQYERCCAEPAAQLVRTFEFL